MSIDTYDYIVVGSGSAGSVIASQLLRRKAGTVLLLEAGGTDKNMFVDMPAGVSRVIPTKTWPYMAEPDAQTKNRAMIVAQGKILGGSSSVNGMIYIRGQRQDFDAWEQEYGCAGWGYDGILPYFRRAERNESLSGEYHGVDGLLPVSENRYRHPLSMAFVRAGQEFGLPYVNDFNGDTQEGVGYYQTTTKNGKRASTAQTYLKAVRHDRNLNLVLNALVHKVNLVDGRAAGVTYSRNGQTFLAKARAEVIVSAGAIGSAKVLMLSGLGPADHLKSVGISPLGDLPVGNNFQDHLHLSVNAVTRNPVSLYGQDKGLNAMMNGIEWLTFKTGIVTSNILEGAAFVDTCGQGRPDVQIHFLPVLDTWDDPDGVGKGRTHGLTLKVSHVQPKARGQVRLASSNPAELPKIHANFLGHPDDVAGQMRAVKLGLKFLTMASLKSEIGEIFSPSANTTSDPAIEDFVRGNCKTVYHPVGTCRMGVDPSSSVVDLRMKVHGIANLRVADTSVFPQITSGNTNAPTIAVAEKGRRSDPW
jgi:choline dehydrogenase